MGGQCDERRPPQKAAATKSLILALEILVNGSGGLRRGQARRTSTPADFSNSWNWGSSAISDTTMSATSRGARWMTELCPNLV